MACFGQDGACGRRVTGFSLEQAACWACVPASEASARIARAREALAQVPFAPPPSSEDEATLERFVSARQSGDIEHLAGLVAEDAVLSVPPQPE